MLWLFYPVALMMLFFAHAVILSNHPVRSVLGLIGCFLCTTVLWLLLEAEFLALALIFVYIGAVMTLFLFMVMMLNIESYQEKDRHNALSVGLTLVVTCILPSGVVWLYTNPVVWKALDLYQTLPSLGDNYNNVTSLGSVLYTDYVWAFEVVAMILLAAILITVGLVARPRSGSKKQVISDQLAVKKSERIAYVPSKETRQ